MSQLETLIGVFASSKLIEFKYAKTAVRVPGERVITLDEVSFHDNPADCWVVIYDRVYDITDFLDEHPGGADILLECAGRDATIPFRGSGHSNQAILSLNRYLIGELPMNERIFRKPGGYKLSDIPDRLLLFILTL